MNFEGKVAFVTGAARGIGRACAEGFAKRGASVILADMNEENLMAASEACRAYGVKVKSIVLDVSDEAAVRASIDESIREFGKIHILVNNAGISQSIPLESYTDEDLDKIMDLNIKAVFTCCKAVAGHMKNNGGGCIINTSSIVSVYGQGLGCMYPASKSAVNGLTRSLSRELGRYGIRVNAVAPGVTRTDMVAALPESMVAPLLQKIPLARMGEAEDIANAALFLASDMASYITGAVIPVDGGAIL
jgi:3-oxoacyl-[acyl-carrier protein] reductase/7-alpha-hydroxysteroid dehydrogenase